MAVTLSDFALPVVNEHLAALVLRDFRRGFNGLFLCWVVRSVALSAFLFYRPAFFSFNDVLVCHTSFRFGWLIVLTVRVA